MKFASVLAPIPQEAKLKAWDTPHVLSTRDGLRDILLGDWQPYKIHLRHHLKPLEKGDGAKIEYTRKYIADCLKASDGVVWQYETMDAALRGHDQFHMTPYQFPELATGTAQFWVFDAIFLQSEKGGGDDAYRLFGLPDKFAGYSAPYVVVHHDLQQKSTQIGVFFQPVSSVPEELLSPHLRMMTELRDGEIITQGIQAVFAALIAFMYSPYVDVEEQPFARPARRHYERKTTNNSTVRNVALRRKQPEQGEHSSSEHKGYSCQWYVRGHWRKHWYPKREIHLPRYIMPHIKGNPEKPLKTPTDVVFHVNR